MWEVRMKRNPHANNRLFLGNKGSCRDAVATGNPLWQLVRPQQGISVFVQVRKALLHQLQFLPDLVNLLLREILPSFSFDFVCADWFEIPG